jgi:NtrC-family two-component system sensor histidine kinase KinB
MQALVGDLLELSRIEAGTIELEYEHIPVRALFERVREIFAGQAGEKAVELAAEATGDVPAIRADVTKVTWVLTNLVSNALRYVSRGGHIQLLARTMGTHVQLAVHDDGPGIPPEYQTRIFQKFVQVRGQEGGGAGLGLAICKEIVRAHGGTIWVESSPGKGSTFTFTMPAVAA